MMNCKEIVVSVVCLILQKFKRAKIDSFKE